MPTGTNTSAHLFDTSFTQEGVLYSAASGVVTSTAAGSAGQVLQSAGNASPPAYSTATYPATAGTSGTLLASNGTNFVNSTATFPTASGGTGKIIYDNGTNFVESTPTFPASASATSGKMIQSDGTNWVASTPTYPATAGSAGKILISDGTNIVSSTPTYPNTSGTAGKVVVSDGTNNVYSTPTFPNASATSGKIIKSDGTNWTASTETYAAPGTSGNVMTSDGTNWTSAAASGAGLKTVTIPLSNSQLKALNTTAITILAAQGAGVVIIPVSIVVKLIYGGSNVFAGGAATQFNYGTVAGTNTFSAPSTSFWTNAGNKYCNFVMWDTTTYQFTAAVCENAAISISTSTQLTGNAANDNTANVQMTYYTISI